MSTICHLVNIDDEYDKFQIKIEPNQIETLVNGKTYDAGNGYKWICFPKNIHLSANNQLLYLFYQAKGDRTRYGVLEVSTELLECLIKICTQTDMSRNSSLLVCLVQMCTKYQPSEDLLGKMIDILEKTLFIVFEEQPEFIKIIQHILDANKDMCLKSSINKLIEDYTNLPNCPTEHDLYQGPVATTDSLYLKNDGIPFNPSDSKDSFYTTSDGINFNGKHSMYNFGKGLLVEYHITSEQLYFLLIGTELEKSSNDDVSCSLHDITFQKGTKNRWIRMILKEIDKDGSIVYRVWDVLGIINMLHVFLCASHDAKISKVQIPVDILVYMLSILQPGAIDYQEKIITELKKDRYLSSLTNEHNVEFYKLVNDTSYPEEFRKEIIKLLELWFARTTQDG